MVNFSVLCDRCCWAHSRLYPCPCKALLADQPLYQISVLPQLDMIEGLTSGGEEEDHWARDLKLEAGRCRKLDLQAKERGKCRVLPFHANHNERLLTR